MLPALLVIARNGFQDHELQPIRKALMASGFSIVLASSEAGDCVGKYGSHEEASVALKDVDVSRYDRIAFIGGPGAEELARDPHALRVARDAASSGRPYGAICIAPTILAAAGVLQEKDATVWDDGLLTQIGILERDGAQYSGQSVTQDGLLLTGNVPDAAEEFGRVFALLEY